MSGVDEILIMSFIYSKKSTGARRNLWGTPYYNFRTFDLIPTVGQHAGRDKKGSSLLSHVHLTNALLQ